MAEYRLKKLISYNIHNNQPKTHARTKGNGMWLVRLYAENSDEQINVDLENHQHIELMSLFPLILEHFTEILGECSPATNAGYNIYQKV